MKLNTLRLHLLEITAQDIPLIHQLNSIPEVDFYNTLGVPNGIEDTIKLIEPLLKAQAENPQVRYVWSIQDLDKNFMGLIGINLGKPNYLDAEVWYKLNPIYWNKGHASEALYTVLDFGFKNLKLHRIHAGCAIENIGSIKVLEKSGFTREAHHRKLLPIRGKWVDGYQYAILEEDFLKSNFLE